MLDKKTETVLRLLMEKAGEGYKVLNKKQLVADLPQKLNLDEQGLLATINFLKENEYVDVKYQDKDEICLATTVKAASYGESKSNIVERASISAKQAALLIVGVFLAAFCGALVATLLGKLF